LSLCARLSLSVSIPITQARVAGVLTFQTHKRAGLRADLLFYARVVLKIRAERRVALQKLRVVDQGRRSAKLLGYFAMAIEKLVEAREVAAGDVIAALGALSISDLGGLPVLVLVSLLVLASLLVLGCGGCGGGGLLVLGRLLSLLLALGWGGLSVLRGRRLRVHGKWATQQGNDRCAEN
jgi:hypothetical protein